MKSVICNVCGASFSNSSNMYRHLRTAYKSSEYRCTTCDMQFSRKDNYRRPVRKQHPFTDVAISGAENHDSSIDGNIFEMSTEPQENYQTGGGSTTNETSSQRTEPQENYQTGSGSTTNETSDCITEDEAINVNPKVYNFPALDKTQFDPLKFLLSNYDKTLKILRTVLLKRQNVKWYLTLQARFKKEKKDKMELVEPYFHGRCHIALKVEDLVQSLRDSNKKIMTSFLEYQRQGSNWTLDKIIGLTLNIAKHKPLRESSFIPLPIRLRVKKAIVNVQNTDQKCFQWAILSALYPALHHAERVSNYLPYADKLEFTGIEFPMQMKDIMKFETQNGISVNVFGHEK